MMARLACLWMATVFSGSPLAPAMAAPAPFKHLSAADIRRTMIGHEFTDETHWFYRFKRDGSIEGASMGRRVKQTWKIVDNRLCVIEAGKEDDCREVWKADRHIELRRMQDDIIPHAGVLRP